MLEHFIPAHAYVKVIALPVLHIAKPKNFKRLSVWLREGKADGPPANLPTPPTTPPPNLLVDSALCSDHGGGSLGGGHTLPQTAVWELVELLVLSGCFLRGTMMSLDLDSLCVWWLFSCSVVSNSP